MEKSINYNQKLYAFVLNSEYHVITRIGKNLYGVVPLFTDSYGVPEVQSDTLEKTLEMCRGRNWKVKEFNTYKEMFEHFLENEKTLEMFDMFGVKDMTGRHFYIEDNEGRDFLGEFEGRLLHYKCATCGNTSLTHKRPSNDGCGGCDNPDWKLMKEQKSFKVGGEDYTHPDGEI